MCLKNTTSWLDTNRWHHFYYGGISLILEHLSVEQKETESNRHITPLYRAVAESGVSDDLINHVTGSNVPRCGFKSHPPYHFNRNLCEN